MPETYSPLTWINDQAPALNDSNLNRIEVGIEAIDDRAAALERGARSVTSIGFATSITIDVTQAAAFRCVATGDLTVDQIVGGVDGQTISLRVYASGADRTVSFTPGVFSSALPPKVVPSETWWTGEFWFDSANSYWVYAP